ncbi:MAG: hypothetical protein KDE56_07535 [Anaerolineales bacterium]|nr:hypothetical protein [Anaerolineales bacterium]
MNELLDKLDDFFADRPGFLPLLGLGLIILNFVLQLVPGPGSGWFVDSNLLLHLGLVTSIVGILLIRVLR